MNYLKTLRLLAFKEMDHTLLVRRSKETEDYIIGIVKKDAPQDYYTYIYTLNDPEVVMKADEFLREGDAVTVVGTAHDSLCYFYGTLTGYTIHPKALLGMSDERKEKYRFKPQERGDKLHG